MPGIAGAEDTRKLCYINEYCSDNATCVHVKQHPLWNADCPYEPSTKDSSDGFCGPGLRCFAHKCLPCMDGMIDYADGKVCVMNEWTLSKWQSITQEPTPVILAVLIGMFCVYALVAGCVDVAKCLVQRKVNKQNYDMQLKQQDSDNEQADNDEDAEKDSSDDDDDNY